MTDLEREALVDDVMERFLDLEIDRSVAERELRLLGLNEERIQRALGKAFLTEGWPNTSR